MRMPQGWEWLIIVLLIVVLFGAKRLPDAARGLGRSLRIFKAETKGLAEDTAAAAREGAGGTTAPAAAPAPAPAPAALDAAATSVAPPNVAPPNQPVAQPVPPAPGQPAAAPAPERAEG